MRKISVYLLIALFASCKRTHQEQKVFSEQELNEHLTNANKLHVQKESEQINDFIKAHHYTMESTGTGLRIQIYSFSGTKNIPAIHDEVSIACNVFLLDGTKCYLSDSTLPIKFRIGEGRVARGLEEGLMKMKVGERARLLIPNHLGYGLSGDGDKIPPGATLFIDVELLKIEK